LLPLFMFITQGRSVFVAAWMIVAVALLALYGLFKSFPKNNFNTSTRYSQ
jgi:archaellum biogenesis protein FlaJ (TadC family)